MSAASDHDEARVKGNMWGNPVSSLLQLVSRRSREGEVGNTAWKMTIDVKRPTLLFLFSFFPISFFFSF